MNYWINKLVKESSIVVQSANVRALRVERRAAVIVRTSPSGKQRFVARPQVATAPATEPATEPATAPATEPPAITESRGPPQKKRCTPEKISPQFSNANQKAIDCATQFAEAHSDQMETEYGRRNLAHQIAPSVFGHMEHSTMRGCAELLTFVFKASIDHNFVNRSLKANAEQQNPVLRKPGTQQRYPIQAEIELVRRIKALRSQKFTCYPHLIMQLADGLIRDTPHAANYPNGVDANWYRRFRLSSHAKELKTASPNPHEEARAQWCTAINARQHYTVLKEVLYKNHINTL